MNAEIESKYVKRLREIIATGDTLYGGNHIEADDILCELLRELGFNAVVDAYEAVEPKWYE